jgi:hypothetical protein
VTKTAPGISLSSSKTLVVRLSKSRAAVKDSDAASSATAIAHGKLRHQPGYTAGMLVHESRILQVTLFETLQNNVRFLDVRLLLADVATIADEVDAQFCSCCSGRAASEPGREIHFVDATRGQLHCAG